jgi:hypothetical protein
MREPSHLREQARNCRTLAKTAIEPELIDASRQSSIWRMTTTRKDLP